MINVEKREIKTIEDYRHSIKLLKHHLKKESKNNGKLRYEHAKQQRKKRHQKYEDKPKVYSLTTTVQVVCDRLKKMGLVLSDVFRMADAQYEGEINKEQFIKSMFRLRTQLDESLFNEMFYAIDTSLNGLISEDEFEEFSLAYGGGASAKKLRKFQKKVKSKLGGFIIGKYGTLEAFLKQFSDPVKSTKFSHQLKELGLNDNEAMLMLKTFDPSHQGSISHKVFLSLMADVKFKSEKEQENEEYQKGIQQLCVQWRESSLNPYDIFEQADIDGKDGVSPFELQQAFKKLMPGETTFQIKKWVSMINLNGDHEVTKEEFLNSIRCFYSLNQMSKFSSDYEKRNPKAPGEEEEESVEKILKELSIKIEDSGMKKKEAFDFIDFDKNGEITKQEMVEGLKGMGMHVGFVGRVVSVFDRDSSETVTLEEWCHLLGEDIELSQVPLPDDLGGFSDFDDQENSKKKKSQKKQQKPQRKEQKPKKQSKPKKDYKAQEKKQNDKTLKHEQKKMKQQQFQKSNTNKTLKQKQFAEDAFSKHQKNKKSSRQFGKNNEQNGEKQDQFHQINLDVIEQKIARKYKARKRTFLSYFRKQDPRNKNTLGKKAFGSSLKKVYPNISQEEIHQIFLKECNQASEINYFEWLEQISSLYAQDVQELEKEEKKMEQSKEQIKEQPNKRSKDLKDNKLLENLLKSEMERRETKRGENIRGFQDLLTLKLLDEGNTKQEVKGYKLVNYIDQQGEHLTQLKQYMKKAESIKKRGKIFKDEDFPPEESSIAKNGKSSIPSFSIIKWKHFSEIFRDPKLFSGKIEPNDIRQGELGNCYFLSALSCLAEYTNMVERLFEYYDLKNGYFLVWLCIDGRWKLVELDGFIPVTDRSKGPVFCKTIQEELWAILLQKAYAKVYGCYNNIIGGQPYEAIKDLSGSPGFQMKHDKESINDIWEKLKTANKEQFLMTGGTKLQESDKKMEGHEEGITSKGIVLGHAYSILDVKEINGERVLQLRNPWGETQWLGDWSDSSSKWTAELKKKLNYEGRKDDGIFWMPIEEFYKHFLTTSINYVRPTYFYESENQKNIKDMIIKLKPSFNNGYVMVSQKDHRHEGLPPNTPYSLYQLVGLVMVKGRLHKKISSKRYLYDREGCVQFPQVKSYPPEAQLVVLVHLNKSANLVLGYYGDQRAEFDIEGGPQMMPYLQQLAEADDANAQTEPGKMKVWMSFFLGVAFLCFKNISSQMTITLNINIPNPSNIRLLPPAGAKNTIKLKPGEFSSIAGKVQNPDKDFLFNEQMSITF